MNEGLGDQFRDLTQQRTALQRRYYARQPKSIGNVIAQVVQRRGYAQIKAASQRDDVWQQIAGELAPATQLGTLRRGVLEILVSNSLQMQELTFRKEELIKQLQNALPNDGIQQLRFRVGQIH